MSPQVRGGSVPALGKVCKRGVWFVSFRGEFAVQYVQLHNADTVMALLTRRLFLCGAKEV